MSSNKICARELARFVSGLKAETLPEGTRTKASQCVLDWLGAAWSGSSHELGRSYTDLALELDGQKEGEATSPIIGRKQKAAMPWAVFANAALGHVTEVDDGHRASIMHVGTVVIPVALALGGKRGLEGKAIMEALVTGYDVAIRVGECLGRGHYATFHTTATAGVFGAAAAAAKAMGLPPEATTWALGHAGTQAAGTWQFLTDGAVRAKPFHPAKAAQNGLVAASLAAFGVEGAERIFEGEKGFCRFASPAPDYRRLVDGLGRRFKIDEVNFKAYPTCGQTHSMLDALGKLVRRHGITADDVERVEARVYRQAIEIAGKPDPRTLEEAKFSVQFCLAFLLSRGELTFDNLTEDAVHDPEVRRLMERIELVYEPEMEAGFPAARPCRIIVERTNGETLRMENRFRRGDPEDPLDTRAIESKFTQLSRGVLSLEQQNQIVDWCARLERVEGVEPFLFSPEPTRGGSRGPHH